MPRLTDAEAVDRLLHEQVDGGGCPPTSDKACSDVEGEIREELCVQCWRAWAYGKTKEETTE